jgi:hypothetical protein
MYIHTNTVLHQLLGFLPKESFYQFVGQHNGDKWTKSLTSWNQLVVLLYAQATGKESLREIETGLSLYGGTWHHLGINTVKRSTLSYANNHRDYRIFEKLFYELLVHCKDVTPTRAFSFENPLYALDATVIKLCLSLFDWAHYTKTKGALKLHTLLNVRTDIPEVIVSSDGKVGDMTAGREMKLWEKLEKGSIVVFDRAYIDFAWWQKLEERGLFFVSRTKSNQSFVVVGQHNAPEGTVLADEYVLRGEGNTSLVYPERLRRVRIAHEDAVYEYVTNNTKLSALQIAEIYTARWHVELFFKWIKQNLTIKAFLGTSENAVLSQVWVAMIYYLLLAYIKFQTKFAKSLLELTRMVRETLLVRRTLIDMLSLSSLTIGRFRPPESPQLRLF